MKIDECSGVVKTQSTCEVPQRDADAILVLDQGQLVGLGSHVTLLGEYSPYAAPWSDYVRSLEGELVQAKLSDKRETM